MKIFVAGATGAIGRRLVPMLVAGGHHVVAMTRSPAKTQSIRGLGAEAVVADGLDGAAVAAAVESASPDVVVHQMTAVPANLDLRKFDREFATTNQLRTQGIDILLNAARKVGARQFVAQSYAGWPYAREGGEVKTEEDPLDPNPPPALRATLAAIEHLEAAVVASKPIQAAALRYGGFYGPGTSIAKDGAVIHALQRRQIPLVGSGAGVWSFIHVDDAAQATKLAIERQASGIFNIVDDDPAPVSQWLPYLARVIAAKPPHHVPVWLARFFIGEHGVLLMTQTRGASNAKAKELLGWLPKWSTWREGFRHGLTESVDGPGRQ